MRAARVHHAARRRGGSVAARGARAAAGDAGDRVSRPQHRRTRSADRLRAFRQGLKETGYVEGENVDDRIPLGEKVNSIDCRRWRPIWFADGWP